MRPELAAVQPVILAGGAGRRLWPLSRPSRPKPFLRIAPGGYSLLQATILRVAGMRAPVIVGAAAHRDLILRDCGGVGVRPAHLLLEPAGRGTAPALAAAAHLHAETGDRLLLILPSDHRIDDREAFLRAVAAGVVHARDGAIVTLGVPATRAETRYGYIERGAPLPGGAARIESFVEKPPADRVRTFMRAGTHDWNSGIFLLRADVAWGALPPAVVVAAQDALGFAAEGQETICLAPGPWQACPAISIDHAIMERTTQGVVVPAAMGWHDVGTWPALIAGLWR